LNNAKLGALTPACAMNYRRLDTAPGNANASSGTLIDIRSDSDLKLFMKAFDLIFQAHFHIALNP
jgi:hypothetical protein